MLGKNQLESMLICCAVNQALPRDNVEGFEASRFWTAAARRAAIAARLADLIDPATRSETWGDWEDWEEWDDGFPDVAAEPETADADDDPVTPDHTDALEEDESTPGSERQRVIRRLLALYDRLGELE